MVKCFKSGHGTLTSFGFALTLPTDVGCFKFSARPFVRAHPHFVRTQHSGCRFMLPVRARTLTSFGFALTLRPDVKRFKFSVRCFVRTPFVSAQFAADFLGGRTKRSYLFQFPAPSSVISVHPCSSVVRFMVHSAFIRGSIRSS